MIARITDRDRRRLDALTARIKPRNSLAFRIEQLAEEQREHYRLYSECMSEFIERCKTQCVDDDEREGRPYACMLDGYGPRLRSAINTALFGKTPRILITDSEDQAAKKWKDVCNE